MLISDAFIPPKLLNRELAATTVSSLAFSVTTVAITCLLIMQPHIGVGVFAILAAVETFSFVATIISLTSFRVRQQNELMQQQARLRPSQRPAIETPNEHPVERQEIIARSNDLEEIQLQFPKIIAAGKTFLTTLIEQYYKTQNKPPEKLDVLNEAFEILSTHTEALLKQPYEVLRMLVFTLIDEQESFLVLNPTLLPYFQSETFYTLCNNIQTESNQLQTLVHQALDHNEPNSFQHTTALLDYLFVKNHLPLDAQQEWIDELLPNLFQFWRVFYLNLIRTTMETLPADLGEQGKFSTILKILLAGFVKLPQFAINKAIGIDSARRLKPFPLLPAYREAFTTCGVMIGAAMIQPGYYGLLDTNHPLRQRLDQIIHSEDFVPPEVEGTDWAAFTGAYTGFLESLTEQIEL